ncbi:MAG: NAD(P)/FAD-dependent oxidoreductase [Burkholderiaceae bacterium]
MRIAIIGSGISGLAAAHRLKDRHEVTLFEADDRAGGHANTVSVTLDDLTYPVDTGFLVLNERTYPNLLALFAELKVPLADSDMSFSASMQPAGVEWAGSNLRSLFAQPANLASPRFLRMVWDILKFNRQATALALAQDGPREGNAPGDEPLGDWLDRNHYGTGFRQWYLLPMAAAIWSCPMKTMNRFPIGSFARFFHNHGLLQIENRPKWMTVKGGSAQYVNAILSGLNDVRLATPVLGVSRARQASSGQVDVRTAQGSESFDAVVLASHSDQTLAMLDDASEQERSLISAVAYQKNTAWLHTDSRLMPRKKQAWAAWNYFASAKEPSKDPVIDGEPRVSVTYWLNKLQPLPFSTDVFVTLNPLREPEPQKVLKVLQYEHPVLDQRAIAAQHALKALQGERSTWFAGAWLGYGFHEDGLASGLAVANGLMNQPVGQSLPRAA